MRIRPEFALGESTTMFDVRMSSGSNTVTVIFSFIFIVCVTFSIPAFVAAIFLDSMRKLRLLKETLDRRPRKDETWGDMKDRMCRYAKPA